MRHLEGLGRLIRIALHGQKHDVRIKPVIERQRQAGGAVVSKIDFRSRAPGDNRQRDNDEIQQNRSQELLISHSGAHTVGRAPGRPCSDAAYTPPVGRTVFAVCPAPKALVLRDEPPGRAPNSAPPPTIQNLFGYPKETPCRPPTLKSKMSTTVLPAQ